LLTLVGGLEFTPGASIVRMLWMELSTEEDWEGLGRVRNQQPGCVPNRAVNETGVVNGEAGEFGGFREANELNHEG
jgi:hypothetical protein